jgi:hypothetical protein
MFDALLWASLNIVSQVFPTLIMDIFKHLSKKNTRVFHNSHS